MIISGNLMFVLHQSKLSVLNQTCQSIKICRNYALMEILCNFPKLLLIFEEF